MGSDALDRLAGRRMGASQRMAYAKHKSEQEEGQFCQDDQKVKETASKFEQEVARQRKAAGLR